MLISDFLWLKIGKSWLKTLVPFAFTHTSVSCSLGLVLKNIKNMLKLLLLFRLIKASGTAIYCSA